MEKLIEFWTNMVATFAKTIDDVPSKIKINVVSNLYESGFITEDDLDEVKDAKVAETSNTCEETIVNGSDIELSDGETYHFSFDYTDQTRISKLNDKAVAGETFLPWHYDNGTCKVFSSADIQTVNSVMESVITYQTTYFNSLRNYINAMTSIDEVLNVTYGIEIPEDYQSEVLQLLNQSLESDD